MHTTTRKLITGAIGAMLSSAALSPAFAGNPLLDSGEKWPPPDRTAVVQEAQRLAINGPSLDGQRVVPRPDRTAVVQEAQRLAVNGPSLDGQRIDLRGHAAR